MSRVVYGAGPVGELVGSRAREIAVLYASGRRAKDEVVKRARGRGVDVEVVADGELDQLAGTGARHQGLVAVVGDFEYADLDALVGDGGTRPPLVVALDGVQDPRNLGAIVRSAYLLGADGVVIPRDRAAGVTAVATKASAGATELLPVAQVTNLARALGELKEAGLWLTAVAAGDEARPIGEIDLTGPSCLVLGGEGSGIRKRVAGMCDHAAVIPMAGAGVGSFNVAVAASIALYEVSRQRG
jgi:23S rRNA (guanosine2251-2'-O)-methyltransferase